MRKTNLTEITDGLQDKWEIQLRKGTLELVILAALKSDSYMD
jgi:hypothetical protein